MTTLRDLAQAVVDAGPSEHVWPVNAPASAMLKALMPEVGGGTSPLYDTARAILAADAAAEARGREAGRREALEPLARKLQCPGCDGEMLIPIDAADGSEHECACGRTMFLHLEDASEMSFGCDYCEDDPFDVCDFCGRAAEVTP